MGIDYRAVGIGSLIPFAIDVFYSKQSLGHSFLDIRQYGFGQSNQESAKQLHYCQLGQ